MTLPSSPIFLGIDTGGTFTDGVLLNPRTGQVLQTVKVLTTHHDLQKCIAEVLECILPADTSSITLVSLSTTLATNAIAEGKRKPVALFLLGYDPELVHSNSFQRQFGTRHYFFINGRHNQNGVEQIALDNAEIERLAEEVKDKVDAFAVASYAGPMNSTHEERAAEILARLTGLPVIQAHHLSSELDSIRRATTASLNASLLSNVQEFLNAVQEMLTRRGVRCPVMMVRGDGSIVEAGYARKRPVEIIHSGPATSSIGGQYLAGAGTALVIDVGGTTTDIALIDKGKVQIFDKAATVGPYRTCVRTIRVRSFGLGGDSLIRFDHWQNLSVGPERVIPMSHFYTEHPEMKQELLAWLVQKGTVNYSDQLETWVLRREPPRPFSDRRTQKAIELLRCGPQRLSKLLKDTGAKSPVLLDVGELVNAEIIDRVGLTPTDLMHVAGEFTPWDSEAARLITEAAARLWGESPEAFIARVRRLITRRIVAEILEFLSGKALSEASYTFRHDDLDRWFYEESLEPVDPYLGSDIFLKIPMIGIGAPAKAFLTPVAEALRTQILFPEHYEVANAVGTVVGNVVVHLDGEVFPCVEGSSITGYFGRAASVQRKFERVEQALDYARRTLVEQAAAEAQAAGAQSISVDCQEKLVMHGMVQLSAWAVGKPG
jgi:N-methylhydantoinase A/oxoprolinase/acetone carboxylase beta subunit